MNEKNPQTEAEALRAERDRLADEAEQLRVQLAGCYVAATCGLAEQEAPDGSYGWSQAYALVLKLRREHDAARGILSDVLSMFDDGAAVPPSIATRIRGVLDGKEHG